MARLLPAVLHGAAKHLPDSLSLVGQDLLQQCTVACNHSDRRSVLASTLKFLWHCAMGLAVSQHSQNLFMSPEAVNLPWYNTCTSQIKDCRSSGDHVVRAEDSGFG